MDGEFWTNKVLKSQDSYELRVSKAIDNMNKDTSIKEAYKTLSDIVYDGFARSYAIAKECLKEEYGIVDNSVPSDELLASLTFNKDGKTVDERIVEHIDKFFHVSQSQLKQYIWRLQDTDAMSIFNNTLTEIASKHGYVGYKIISIGTCSSHGHNCNDEDGKEYAIKDLEHKPPFHPNCRCTIELVEGR